MTDNPRIAELRRRVHKDPASIAFAQLAEEYRRGGDYEDAVRVCRAGLAQHPLYLSARVTLGRALLELGRFPEAQAEFQEVLRVAPDNLSAIRALADLHQRRAQAGEREEDPVVPAAHGIAAPASEPAALMPQDADAVPHGADPFTVALERLDALDVPADPVLETLQAWLGAILADRAERERA